MFAREKETQQKGLKNKDIGKEVHQMTNDKKDKDYDHIKDEKIGDDLKDDHKKDKVNKNKV